LNKLTDILKGVDIIKTIGSTDTKINSLQFDSRNVNDGDLFIAIKGTQVDGHSYIKKAIQSGSKVIICEILPEQKKRNYVCSGK